MQFMAQSAVWTLFQQHRTKCVFCAELSRVLPLKPAVVHLVDLQFTASNDWFHWLFNAAVENPIKHAGLNLHVCIASSQNPLCLTMTNDAI